jgi:hypothetical protein
MKIQTQCAPLRNENLRMKTRKDGRAATAIATTANGLDIKRPGIISVVIPVGGLSAVGAVEISRTLEFATPDRRRNGLHGLAASFVQRVTALEAAGARRDLHARPITDVTVRQPERSAITAFRRANHAASCGLMSSGRISSSVTAPSDASTYFQQLVVLGRRPGTFSRRYRYAIETFSSPGRRARTRSAKASFCSLLRDFR